jgi:cytochrome c5
MRKKILVSLMLIGLLAACGKKEETPAAAPQAQAPAATAQVDENLVKGERVYKSTCAMCHGTGAGGAPMFKSKAEWEPRISQGKETLYEHALKGFNGSKGAMPAKGGNAALPDDEVKAAVDYMVSMAK